MRAWEGGIRRTVPYVPGDQPKGKNIVKLNTNENPYPPAPGVARCLKEMDYEQFRKYPDPSAGILTEALAGYYGLKNDQVFVGVGSDDVLAMAFLTFFNTGRPILFPDISYSFYQVWAGLYGIPYDTPQLDENFQIVPEDYKRVNGGVIFPNPNAPTGLFMPLDQVEEIVAHNQDVVVIVDEAYIDFGGISALSLTSRYENLLVVQTFSKSRSMAGMRIGYAMGSPSLIRALHDVKFSYNSYTMNETSLLLGTEAVKDDSYFKNTLNMIMKTREDAKLKLKGMGFSFPDSLANFIFARHNTHRALELYDALRARDIYVRYFNQPRLEHYLRITVGTEDEMEKLYRNLKEIL